MNYDCRRNSQRRRCEKYNRSGHMGFYDLDMRAVGNMPPIKAGIGFSGPTV